MCPWKDLTGFSTPILQTCIILSVEHDAKLVLFCQSTSSVGAATKDNKNTVQRCHWLNEKIYKVCQDFFTAEAWEHEILVWIFHQPFTCPLDGVQLVFVVYASPEVKRKKNVMKKKKIFTQEGCFDRVARPFIKFWVLFSLDLHTCNKLVTSRVNHSDKWQVHPWQPEPILSRYPVLSGH